MKKNRITTLKIFRVIFPKMVKSCPGLFMLSATFSMLNSICMGVLIYLSQNLYDVVIQAVEGQASKSMVISEAIVFGTVTIINQILNGLSVYIMNIIFEIINRDITYEVHNKADKLKALSYENENIYNQFQMAIQGKNEAVLLLFICFTPLTCHLPLYLFLGSYFYLIDPKLVFAILLIFFPICVGYFYKIKAKEKLVNEAAEPTRKMKYYQTCITGRDYFKETRILGAFAFFKDLFFETLDLVNNLEKVYKTKSLKIDVLSKMVTMTGYGIVLYIVFNGVIKGSISVGAFAAVLNGINLLFDEMKELISDDIGENISSIGAIRSLIDFLDLPEGFESEKKKDGEYFSPRTIILKDISFKYPNSEHFVLKNIDLQIRAGETVALVGKNGSGKTTLTKILLGLYEPTKGEIKIDGINDWKNINSVASGVFQNFCRYKMTLKDNITISDVVSEVDEMKLNVLLDNIGINRPLNTNLTVEFGGVDLSGGEWQRVAIARGIYRSNRLIVLDEPTASIDPIEESNIYRKFLEIINNRTAVLVTHRIGAAKIADRIIVMEDGYCIDSGTHQELMSRCENYREMYVAQAEWYN